jgi:nicotinamidase-related amidase
MHSPLKPTNVALLVCDLQERFQKAIFNFPSILAVADRMLDAASIMNLPVLVTEHYPSGLGYTIPSLRTKFDALPSKNRSIFSKTLFSMYIPELEEFLRSRKIEHVALLGIEAHVCILQTVLDLTQNGVQVHLLADGISSRHQMDREIALRRLERNPLTYLTTSESFLFQLMKDAKYDKFRSISELVKKTDKSIYDLFESCKT